MLCNYCGRDERLPYKQGGHLCIDETPMIERFWDWQGTLIEELSVPGGRRRVDGIILPERKAFTLGGETKSLWLYTEMTIAQRRELRRKLTDEAVFVVQAKARQIGFGVMGQALFSRPLLDGHVKEVVSTIALVGKRHAALDPLVEERGVEIVVDGTNRVSDGKPPTNIELPENGVELVKQRIRGFWREKIGQGALAFHYPLLPNSRYYPTAHAVVIKDGSYCEIDCHEAADWERRLPASLRGLEVVILTTRDKEGVRPGMCSTGRALFSYDLVEKQKPKKQLESVIPCEDVDPQIEKLLKPYAHFLKLKRGKYWAEMD